MQSVECTAPGKVILCGEHSVVYGEPAIAVPVSGLRAHAHVAPADAQGLRLTALDLGESLTLAEAPDDYPLAVIVRLTLAHCSATEPDAELTMHSDLPIAAGLGSGAAVSVAAARALALYLGHDLPPEEVSALAYEVEKLHHGTPSGIDNTVVAWERPVAFTKGTPPSVFNIARPFYLIIANSGLHSTTREIVEGVRQRRETDPDYYNTCFKAMGAIAEAARVAIEQGGIEALGPLINQNHALLTRIGVSLPALDALVAAARRAGATGAKLTGAGGGGNIIALVTPENANAVRRALQEAGAVQTWQTTVE